VTRSDISLPPISREGLATRILALLPADGTPVLNRIMRVLLARELETRIDQDLYFDACDLLVQRGKIGRLRGQSGQIFLSAQVLPQAFPQAAPAIVSALEPSEKWPELWSEARLMQPVRRYLEGTFTKGLDLPSDGATLVIDTSLLGPPKGRWARPDFVLVSAMKFDFLPGAQVDVHSFELKTETGGSVLAVHEALAQTRFTHFGHLIWHLPEKSKAEARYGEIDDQCKQHGIGLIRMRDPLDPAGYETIRDPVRKNTPPSATEGFLQLRLSEDQKRRLTNVVRG
jgi:hypothetical protein